jgi:hypothetical protein
MPIFLASGHCHHRAIIIPDAKRAKKSRAVIALEKLPKFFVSWV